MKRWTIQTADSEAVAEISRKSDLGPLLSEIMVSRGYDTPEKLIDFFNVDELSDPFLLTDMQKAVDVINNAVDLGKRITVFGDYDCDGICATAILYGYLLSIGADVSAVIPEREDGYGLNRETVERMRESGTELIITVDNGISAIEESALIKELGMELVVTDHHQPYEKLPEAEAVVDPHREDDFSEYKELCGAGVALKLCAALDGGNYDAVIEQYCDLAAIATVADVTPLTGENRVIVRRGLELLKNTENMGLLDLMEKCSLGPEKLSSQSVAFTLAPRINAASRFGSARTAFEMLTCEDGNAGKYADELIALNSKRHGVEDEIMREITEAVENDPELKYSRVLTVAGKGWRRGVIGIIAARLTETYERPSLVISVGEDGIAVGSARSIKGFNIFRCFEYCRELLIRRGGHELAGGLTVAEENIPRLKKMIEEFAASECKTAPKITLCADKLLRGKDITYENAVSLKRIQPCGVGNPEPLFALSGAIVSAVYPLSGGEHTKLILNYDGAVAQALLFRVKTDSLGFKPGDRIDMMANMRAEEYNGKRSASLIAVDFRPHGAKQEKYFAAEEVYLKFRRGESTDKKLLELGLPTRDEMVGVYNAVKLSGGVESIESLYAKLSPKGINAFKLRIIIDAFCDTRLMELKRGRAVIIPPTKKEDVMSAETVTALKEAVSRETGNEI